jgi:putative membrane protein
MKPMIWNIFRADLRAVVRQFFAFVIVLAVCILPALYAWFNIYANWDPYRDAGYRSPEGAAVNKAEEVMDTLRESRSIRWEFPASPEEAIEGAKRGDYYAAIIFSEDFTARMYDLSSALSADEPALTYYENGKKNAVASKITQTAASTLQETINQTYLRTLLSMVFRKGGQVDQALTEADAAALAAQELSRLQSELGQYADAISAARDGTAQLCSLLDAGGQLSLPEVNGVALDAAASRIARARAGAASAADTAEAGLDASAEKLAALSDVLAALEQGAALPRAELNARLDRAFEAASSVEAHLRALRALFPAESALPGAELALSRLDGLVSRAESIREALQALRAPDADLSGLSTLAASWSVQAGQMRDLVSGELRRDFDAFFAELDAVLAQTEPMLSALGDLGGDLGPVADSAAQTLSGVERSLGDLEQLLRGAAKALGNFSAGLEELDAPSRVRALVGLFGGEADRYGDLFSALVDVSTEEIYAVNSYGTAMTPFYSVLAIWVGGVILVSILKVQTDENRFPGTRESERFFGRFLLFFLLGQIQAAVIVLGDLHLLGVQAAQPWLLWLSAAVTSMVFVLLIYSLTLSFGDIGKAIVVVVMVLQIAGSSGSYPIEILPPIFEKIYRFFPFPYAINAMREAICGVYRQDLLVDLLELGLFGVLGLIIGLVVRRPFMGVNAFVEEKLEETEVL